MLPVRRARNTITTVEPEKLNEAGAVAISKSVSAKTKAVYKQAWKHFVLWCRAHGTSPLPATPTTVVNWLAGAKRADGQPLSPRTLRTYLAAVATAHRLRGLPSPTEDAAVSMALTGVTRERGGRPKQKAALTIDLLSSALDALPNTTGGARDKALFLLGYGASLRRGELVRLLVGDIEFVKDGLWVTLDRSKGDQEGRGARIFIAAAQDPSYCPVEVLRRWIRQGAAAGASFAPHMPLFRKVDKHGIVGATPLGAGSVAYLIKRRLKGLVPDLDSFSAHSLRAGLPTDAARDGASLAVLRDHMRHKNITTTGEYVRLRDLATVSPTRGAFDKLRKT